MRVYILNRYRKRKKTAQEFLGNKCSKCGSIEDLQFDHKDRVKKKFTIGKLWSIGEKEFWKEIKKCQLLCRTCHNKKTLKELGLREAKGYHGTVSTYRYCHCDLCRHAASKWNREYMQRRRLMGR